MRDFKSATNAIWYHTKVLFRGLKRVVYGAATAGLFGLAGYGFAMIPSEGGYIAVCEFLAAIATMCVGMTCVYHQGCPKRRKGGFEK